MRNLLGYVKENFESAKAVNRREGDNGPYLSVEDTTGAWLTTIPVSKKNDGKITEFNVVITDDGTAIATTASGHDVTETVTL